MRLTHQQNVLLPWIPNERVDDLLAEPARAGARSRSPTFFNRALQTCTGKEFCGLAKVHTKGPDGGRAAEIAAFLDTHVTPNGHGEDFRAALRRAAPRAAPSTRSRTSASRAS